MYLNTSLVLQKNLPSNMLTIETRI